MEEFSLHPLLDHYPDLEAEAAQAAATTAASMAETAAAQAGETVRSDETPTANVDWNDPHAGNLAQVGYREELLEAIEEGVEEEDEQEDEDEQRTPHGLPQGSLHPPSLRGLQTVQLPVDHSMRNAWFPGQMGGVTFAKRKVPEGLIEREERMRGSWDRVDHEREHEYDYEYHHEDQKIGRRDETVFSISGLIPDVNADGKCASLAGDEVAGSHLPTLSSSSLKLSPHPRSSTSPTPGSSSSEAQAQAQQSWVYETYDPTRIGAHDHHLHHVASSSSNTTPNPSCAHCVAIADARLAEKKKAAVAARKALDRAMVGIGESLAPMDVDSDADADGEGDVKMEMEDFDMSGFRLGDDNDDNEAEEDEAEEEGEEEGISVLGDDLPNGQPGFWTDTRRLSSPSPERGSNSSSSSRPTPQSTLKHTYIPSTRREFERSRITTAAPCSGIQDIALSGQTPPQHALWYTGGQGYTFYGRVRPWDGLIGIMRVGAVGRRIGLGLGMGIDVAHGDGQGTEEGLLMDTTFIFGYLVGDGTFVGEWRVAGADPLRPAWSGPIVLSRR